MGDKKTCEIGRKWSKLRRIARRTGVEWRRSKGRRRPPGKTEGKSQTKARRKPNGSQTKAKRKPKLARFSVIVKVKVIVIVIVIVIVKVKVKVIVRVRVTLTLRERYMRCAHAPPFFA